MTALTGGSAPESIKPAAENDQCEHPHATVNHQGIYTCPDCWHRVPAPAPSDQQATS